MNFTELFNKLCFSLFVLTVVGLFIPQTAFCQTEKLGIVQYTPPPRWNKTPKENVVAFSDLNQTTGGFCIITVYGATQSVGNPQSDFTKEWNNLVVQPLKAEANPKTETEAADGWTAIAGGAAVEFQGGKALAFLTVFSGFGKTVSVLGVLNDQSYLPQLQTFVGGIEMDKTVAGAVPAPATIKAGQPGKFGAFGSMTYTTPAGWKKNKNCFPGSRLNRAATYHSALAMYLRTCLMEVTL